jgi:integrase
MKRVKLLKEPPGRLRYLTFDEAERLLKELPEAPAAVVAFALNTGMRKGEILGLKWRDINFDQKQIAVEKTKTNERRWVPINDQVYRILEAQKGPRKPSDPVFADGAVNLRKHFEGAVKRANLENFRFHDCRHSFASQLVMSGANIRVVQQLLGHKDIKMTMRYSHLSQDHLQEAVEKLGYRFGIGTNLAQDFSHPSEMGLSH